MSHLMKLLQKAVCPAGPIQCQVALMLSDGREVYAPDYQRAATMFYVDDSGLASNVTEIQFPKAKSDWGFVTKLRFYFSPGMWVETDIQESWVMRDQDISWPTNGIRLKEEI